jgi:Rrf2 family protein
VRISAKVEYACLAVIALAERYHSGRPVPIREIVGAKRIPAPFLTQILLKLRGAGLVVSTRGSSGGYRLARPPDKISLNEVVQIVDGYSFGASERTGPAAPVLTQFWNQLRAYEIKLLSGTSIAALVERANGQEWVI